ncbi:MAG TPA: RNA-binding S4 domain-containing protein, partial [Aquabacterium sp.]|nr:RNA-binding S4 domain-containing protein [Aquabacterium sp.]
KASRELRAGDRVDIRQAGGPSKTVIVRVLSTIRGPAPQAQQLYEETPESIERRQQQAEQRRLGVVEPAESIVQGRPTKRDRRQLADWDRWSASADDIGD